MPVVVGTYWWTDVLNFGDWLSPYLLDRFSEVTAALSPVPAADLVAVGSVLEHVRGWRGRWVVGSGKLHESTTVNVGRAKILGLRGPLTAKGVPGDYALGDPGLLADELVPLPAREHKLGILSHWTDTELATRPEFLRYKPLVINSRAMPLGVISQIGSCDKIVTSSLHGLIVADAFGIPRRFEPAKTMARPSEGGLFKFRDYHASINMPFEPGVTATPNRHMVEDRQHQLYDMLRELGRLVR